MPTTFRKPPYRMNLAEIKNALSFDRYPSDERTVRAVKAAAKAHTLVWTSTRLAILGENGFDIRPYPFR